MSANPVETVRVKGPLGGHVDVEVFARRQGGGRGVVRNTEFDANAVLLTPARATAVLREVGLKLVERRFIAFLPLAGRGSAAVDSMLRWLPLGGQCYVVGSKRPL